MTNGRKTPWQFACDWYQPEEIFYAINRRRDQLVKDTSNQIPSVVTSQEFAEWLTHQYRLAMRKGIEIGQRWAAEYETEGRRMMTNNKQAPQRVRITLTGQRSDGTRLEQVCTARAGDSFEIGEDGYLVRVDKACSAEGGA